LCQGSAFNDPEGAERAALGESAERYCGNILDTLPITEGSYYELRRKGIPVLDPSDLVLYSEGQYNAHGFPFVPFTRDLRVHWVTGRSLVDDREILVPASLVYVNWYSAGFAADPPTNFCAFAGIAAGPNLDFAVASGMEEIIERHATMVWWLNAQPMPRVESVAAPLVSPPLRAAFVYLDNEFGVPVAAAIVHDDESQLVNIGFSARPAFEQAASKALTEAFTLQEGSRDLLRPDGLQWKVMAAGELNGRAFKPWRADRRYLDDFREDMHDCDDLMVQQEVYLDPRAGRRMRHLLEPDSVRDATGLPELPSRSRETMVTALGRAGTEPIVVDITTPDIASAGLRVVRVIAPGTVGNGPAAFPFLGRDRVRQIPVELGWRDSPRDEAALNYFPLPHA
jgi:ribosomal protein S12 methylthiotransferase accessory factor